MNKQSPRARRPHAPTPGGLRPVAAACAALCSLGLAPAWAQQAAPSAEAPQSIVITGIRQALETTLTLKRDSRGLVDGIVAESASPACRSTAIPAARARRSPCAASAPTATWCCSTAARCRPR